MAANASPLRTGMILGKFLPPHLGHVHCVDLARRFVDRLTVLVCSLSREPIPGVLRYQWMSEMFPDCDVRHVTEELPQQPAEHPEFWRLWREAIRREMPVGPDFVFASEGYGTPLAEELGARFIPVDVARTVVPVSGTVIRTEPLKHWRYLPACVRPYFVKRVCLFGPESTGKSTLARDLARHYETVWVPEFARGLLDLKGGRCDPDDIPLIARGQPAAEEALARQANRVLISDTDVLTTSIWSDLLFGSCPAWIREAAGSCRYDLTLLLDVDVPWMDDGQRFFPDCRKEQFDRFERELRQRGRRYLRIHGNYGERFARAVTAIDDVLSWSNHTSLR